MKKIASSTLMSREEKEGKNSFDSATSEINYPEKKYQSLNATYTNTMDGNPTAEPFGYSEGKISPVDGELSDDITTPGPKEASLRIFKSLVASGDWSSIATYNVELKSDKILKYSSDKKSDLHKDLRFSTIDRKYDLFYFDFSQVKKEDLQYCIANALSSSRPASIGFISGIDNSSLKQITDLGFSKSGSLLEDKTFFIKKNDLNKIANVKVLNLNGAEKASFLCDIAETLEEKIAGLQPYRSLKYGSGLLFPYQKPQDVTYHMGSVSFPIDIIFVGSNGKIKKIAENIQPGTLGVFGSSNISYVLEIAGGASSMLDIRAGDIISSSGLTEKEYLLFEKNYKNFSNSNNFYVKTASFSKKISFENFDIFNHDKSNLSAESIVKMGSLHNKNDKSIVVYNFDEFFTSDFGKVLNTNISKLSEKVIYEENISKTGALSDFLAKSSFTPFEIRRAFFEIEKDLNNNKKIVIATQLTSNINLLKSFFVKRASEEIMFDSKIHSLDFISIPPASNDETLGGLLDRYSSNVEYKKVSFDKIAGAPISDSVKEKASESLDILLSIKEDLDKVIEAFKNNSEQYTKAKDKPELIKKSEKEYNLSCKRISKLIVTMLLKVKKTIGIMGKIKDISTVDEKIESLSLSCKEFVTTAEGIFNLQSKIKQDDFVDLLTAETNRIEKSGEDVENNINNFSDYISKNILNKRILSR